MLLKVEGLFLLKTFTIIDYISNFWICVGILYWGSAQLLFSPLYRKTPLYQSLHLPPMVFLPDFDVQNNQEETLYCHSRIQDFIILKVFIRLLSSSYNHNTSGNLTYNRGLLWYLSVLGLKLFRRSHDLISLEHLLIRSLTRILGRSTSSCIKLVYLAVHLCSLPAVVDFELDSLVFISALFFW